MSKRKILIVSPFIWNSNVYPHLYEFKVNIEKQFEVEYTFFPERGYWIEDIVKNWKSNKFKKKGYRHFYQIVKSFFDLYKYKKENDIHRIIAIDNFIYIVCCLVFDKKNVILWSHDFVSEDNERRGGILQKSIRKKTKKYLENSLLIIQTEERRRFFLNSLGIVNSKIETFYMPVCLNKSSDVLISKMEQDKKPVVLQIGGINQNRSNSVTILKNFNFKNANLSFHGFISNEFKNELKLSNSKPEVSDKIMTSLELLNYVNKKCDIGILSYNCYDQNFYNIACSSGQFAEFMRAYKPVISYGDNTLTNFINDKKIGIGIKDIKKLNEAVNEIHKNYNFYVENIIKFLDSGFNLINYTDKLCEILKKEEDVS